MATVATLGAADNTNTNKKDSHKKKKRAASKLIPNILNYGNNNTLLKSVVVTLTTPIATTTITVNNVNLNNNNITHLAKQGSDAGSILFTPTVRKHELPGHHPPVLNNGTTGTGSASTPSPPPAPPVSAAPPVVLPPPPSPVRTSTPPPKQPPPQLAQPLPPPAAAPTIPPTHFSMTNGPLVGHPGLSNHPRLPSPAPPVATSSIPSQPPRSTITVNSSYPPPPPNQYPSPSVPNPAYISPHPHPHSHPHPHPHPHSHPHSHPHAHTHPVTTSYVPPQHTTTAYVPHSHSQPQPHCTTGLSVTSNSNPVVVAAPSSYVPTSIPPLSNYPPLYAPYNNTPYLSPIPSSRINRSPLPVISSKSSERQPGIVTTTAAAVVTTTTTTSHRDIVSTPLVGRSHSPRGHSPTRERDSYSSNVSSLSRGSVTPVSLPAPPSNSSPFSAPAPASVAPPPSNTSSLPYNKTPVWVGGSSSAQLSSANSVVRHQLSHAFPAPMFAPPVAAAPATASSVPSVSTVPAPAPPPTNPNPFSAESLFQSNQADLLRRELDTRFLASQERNLVPPPYLRTEMHHHQHQHTHVHQHTAPMLPPAPPTLFTPPIFKDIPKLGGVDSPFYRQNIGLSSYPGFSPGLLHPGLGATPFAPPNHLPTFTPKQVTETSKPKPVKTGKWNAMHVRIAWEIYHHQQKQAAEVKAGVNVGGSSVPSKSDLLRPPTHLFPGPPRPHDLSSFAAPHRAPHVPFDNPAAHPPGPPFTNMTRTNVLAMDMGGMESEMKMRAPLHPHDSPGWRQALENHGAGMKQWSRVAPIENHGSSMFGRYPQAAPFPSLAAFPHGAIHDPWSRLQPRTTSFPAGIGPPWSLKPEPGVSEAEREREREREREKERERSRERERCRREEKQRRLLAAQQQANKIRERSPLREPATVVPKEEEVVLLGRPPPHYLARHPTTRTLPPHFAPPWDHPYRYDHLRFNPLMAAFRAEEEEQRAKLFGAYPPPPPHMRGKAPSPHRPVVPTHQHPHPHTELHKKEESSQSR